MKKVYFLDQKLEPDFDVKHEGYDMSIIQNKSKWGFLMPEQNKIDFFLKITPKMLGDKKEDFMLKLNKISKILLIFELDLQKEQEAHRFIFND